MMFIKAFQERQEIRRQQVVIVQEKNIGRAGGFSAQIPRLRSPLTGF